MKKATLAIAAVALLGIGAAQAQTHFGVRVGGAFATSDFAKSQANYQQGQLNWGLDDQSKKGGAGMGFTVGGIFKYDIASVKGLGIIASVDAIYNSINSDIRDYYEDYIDATSSSTTDVEITLPCYINIPIMAGLNYTYDATSTLGIYGEVAIGANIRFITNEVGTTTTSGYSASETVYTIEYNTATTFGYRIGAGLVFNGKYTLGIDYFSLGQAKAEGMQYKEVNGVEQPNPTKLKGGKITPTDFTIRFGINF